MAPLVGKSECFIHDAHTATARAASRRKAGQRLRVPNARAPLPVSTIADLQRHIGQALGDAMQHENSLKRAAVVARLVMAAARLIEEGETRALLESLRDEVRQLQQEAAR